MYWALLSPPPGEEREGRGSAAHAVLTSDTDSLHAEAVALAENLRERRRPLIIPAEVLAETLNVLRPRLGNRATVTIGNELLTSADIAVIPTPREVLELTLTKLQRQTGNASYIEVISA